MPKNVQTTLAPKDSACKGLTLRNVIASSRPAINYTLCVPFLHDIAYDKGDNEWLVFKLARDRMCEYVLPRLGNGKGHKLFVVSLLEALKRLVRITRPELERNRNKVLAAMARNRDMRRVAFAVIQGRGFWDTADVKRFPSQNERNLVCNFLDIAIAWWQSQNNQKYAQLPQDLLKFARDQRSYTTAPGNPVRKLIARIDPTLQPTLNEANIPLRELDIIPKLTVLWTENPELERPPFRPSELLEGQFRLLREDNIRLLRDPSVFFDPRHPRISSACPESFDINNGRTIIFSFCMEGQSGYDRLDQNGRTRFWLRSSLLHSSWLVVLLEDDMPKYFARVERSRNIPDLLEGRVQLCMLDEAGKQDMIDAVCRQTASASTRRRRFTLVQVSPLFAFEPVLRRLQSMEKIPRVLATAQRKRRYNTPTNHAGVQAPGHTTVAAAVANHDEGDWVLQGNAPKVDLGDLEDFLESRKLNKSQRQAVQHALNRPCALIQGPPGTGKTHVGVVLSDYLVRRKGQKMLVCCYTNHALDQFLEELLGDKGKGRPCVTRNIVRLGGRCKREALKSFTLPAWRKRGQSERDPSKEETEISKEETEISKEETEISKEETEPAARQKQHRKQLRHEKVWLVQEIQALRHELMTPLRLDKQSASAVLWFLLRHGTIEERAAFGLPVSPQVDFESKWQSWCVGKPVRGLPSKKKGGMARLNARLQAADQQQPSSCQLHANKHAHAAALRFFFQLGTRKEKQALVGFCDDRQWDKLWQHWCDGSADPISRPSSRVPKLWQSNKRQRWQRVQKWNATRLERYSETTARLMAKVEKVDDQMERIKRAQDRAVLEKADVVACTTTGAAMNHDVLSHLNIPIFLAEEAAEILEAHILTSVPQTCERVILIGDHKQLRPKVQNYEFQVESHQGYDLNVSLFERLTQIVPPATLKEQHRMRPEISRFVRKLTYPELRDHSNTKERADVVGLHRPVLFLDHNEPEDQSDDSKTTKQNTFEARMVHQIVQHLLLQGYSSRDIAVITPYAGQARLLDAQLRGIVAETEEQLHVGCSSCASATNKRCNAERQTRLEHGQVLSAPNAEETRVNVDHARPDIDSPRGSDASPGDSDACDRRGVEAEDDPDEETREAVARNQDAALSRVAAKTYPIRVRTVDNFQGEEAKIVVASLVRSNPRGVIGFLRAPERVNVLLSRARDCMILIGNKSTLQSARNKKGRKLWQSVFQLLDERSAVEQSFPVFCPRHPSRRISLVPSAEIREPVEPWNDGGCDEMCGAQLACGHTCPLRCHGFGKTVRHDKFLCKQPIFTLCRKVHVVHTHCHVVAPNASEDQVEYDIVCPPCMLLEELGLVKEHFRRDLEELKRTTDCGEDRRSRLEEQYGVLRRRFQNGSKRQRKAYGHVCRDLQATTMDVQHTRVLRCMLEVLLAKKEVHAYQQLVAFGERLRKEMKDRKAELLEERDNDDNDDDDDDVSNDSVEDYEGCSQESVSCSTNDEGTDDDTDDDGGSEHEEEAGLPPDDPRTKARLLSMMRACSGSDGDSSDTEDDDADYEEDDEEEDSDVESDNSAMVGGKVNWGEEEGGDEGGVQELTGTDERTVPHQYQGGADDAASSHGSSNIVHSGGNDLHAAIDSDSKEEEENIADGASPDSGYVRNSVADDAVTAPGHTAWELWARHDYEQLVAMQADAHKQLFKWRDLLEAAKRQLNERQRHFERATRFLGEYMLREVQQGADKLQLCHQVPGRETLRVLRLLAEGHATQDAENADDDAVGSQSTAEQRDEPPFKEQLLKILQAYTSAFSAMPIGNGWQPSGVAQDCTRCNRSCCPYCLRHAWSPDDGQDSAHGGGLHVAPSATCDGLSCDRMWRFVLQQPMVDVGLCQAKEALAALQDAAAHERRGSTADVGRMLEYRAERNEILARFLKSEEPISRCVALARYRIGTEKAVALSNLQARVAMARALQVQLLVRVMLRDTTESEQEEVRKMLREQMRHLRVWRGPVGNYDDMTRATGRKMIRTDPSQGIMPPQELILGMTPLIGVGDVDLDCSAERLRSQRQQQHPVLAEEDAGSRFEIERQRELDIALGLMDPQDHDSEGEGEDTEGESEEESEDDAGISDEDFDEGEDEVEDEEEESEEEHKEKKKKNVVVMVEKLDDMEDDEAFALQMAANRHW